MHLCISQSVQALRRIKGIMFANSEMKSSKFIYKLVYFLKDKSSIYIYGYLFNFFHVLYFLIEVGGGGLLHRPF